MNGLWLGLDSHLVNVTPECVTHLDHFVDVELIKHMNILYPHIQLSSGFSIR